MGRKGKAADAEGDVAGAAGEGTDAAAGAALVLAQATCFLDALQMDEAVALLERELKASPGCAHLQELLGEAREMEQCFVAEGVALAPAALPEEATAGGLAAGSASRGRGLVTSRRFRRGEVVLREGPLLAVPRLLVTLGKKEAAEDFDVAAARAAYGVLSPRQRRLLAGFEAGMHRLPEGLAGIAGDRELEPLVRLARVMTLNAHEYGPEPEKAALYLLIARANHSCDPVCGLDAAPGGELLLYALRDLEAGEEVLYSYLGGHFTLQPAAVRQRQLLQVKLFECRCARCLVPEPEQQLPCGAQGCGGFLARAGADLWRCGACATEEGQGSQRLAGLRRLEPLWGRKVQDLEADWHNPNKDVAKYISDWESLAKSCRRALGARHHTCGRACFFALSALNTGRALGVGGVGAERHAGGVRDLGLPLLEYLLACCPPGACQANLEPLALAAALLGEAPEHRELVAEVARRAGADELRLCLRGEANAERLRQLGRALGAAAGA